MDARHGVLALAVGALLLVAPAAAGAAPNSGTAALQTALRAKGLYADTIDGVRGPGTDAAVREFQRRRGLVVDGVAGPATRNRLGWRGRPGLGRRGLSEGDRGWDVAGLQFLLGRGGFPGGPVDGRLGARTAAALKRFQQWAGIAADGVAGPATLSALHRPPPRSVLRFAPPMPGPVGDRFGPRGNRFHAGIDYPAEMGAPVSAAGRGCVLTTAYDADYGNVVIVSHRLGMTSLYAHLQRIDVRPGQCVVAGNRIGLVGSTGRSTGPHLHFELRLRGAAVDPLSGL